MMKPGTRLKSAVCDAEIMIIKIAESVELTCGGQLMSEAPEKTEGDADSMHGCLIGKRYVNAEETIEVLCVKSGYREWFAQCSTKALVLRTNVSL